MSIKTKTPNLLEDRQVPVQAKLAAAWTSFMFLYLYVDILNFFKPGVINEILAGKVFVFDISPTLLTVFLVSVSIPALMVALSMVLPARASRTTNLIVASLYIPYTMFNASGESWDWAFFYGISIGLEVLLLAYILYSAWRLNRIPALPADPVSTGLRV